MGSPALVGAAQRLQPARSPRRSRFVPKNLNTHTATVYRCTTKVKLPFRVPEFHFPLRSGRPSLAFRSPLTGLQSPYTYI